VPAVVEAVAPVKAARLRSTLAVPTVIAGAGNHAARWFLEFFAATIRNKNTRMAYYRAAYHFFAWVEQHEIGELADIEPIHVATYIEVLQTTAAKPTVKLHLAAIRMLFDWLVVGQVLAVNPAHAVRGPKHVVKRGKTPVLTEDQARDGKTPLFRSAIGKTGVLSDKPMDRVDAYRMVRRRTAEAGFTIKLGCHVFRATGITAYLEAGGTLENAQAMAAHESPRTTKPLRPHRR
jgi:site-specific recombinase XerD